MQKTAPQFGGSAVALPAGAPTIRITAGAGSAGQKTWNIRRPVTLIGSRRPAHIVLHDGQVSKCHCVIVNTGTEVLLKDLHTTHGTYCNQERADLVVLADGDVVTVGSLKIQIAIQQLQNQKDDSGCGLKYTDPTRFPAPVMFRLDHTDQQWPVEDAVVLIGRHKDAGVRVDHPDVAPRHALLFKSAGAPAVFDLGGWAGIAINGQRCPMGGVKDGDRLAIGPVTMLIGPCESAPHTPDGFERPPLSKVAGQADGIVGREANASTEPGIGSVASTDGPPVENRCHKASPFMAVSESVRATGIDHDSAQALSKIESELAALQKNMSGSWDRLNSWESQLREDATRLDKAHTNLSTREAELDARDAALRGQLHDLTCYHEQITERERELAAQLANIQEEKDCLASTDTELARREAEITRRATELRNREHVLALRWARLQSTTGPHSGPAKRA